MIALNAKLGFSPRNINFKQQNSTNNLPELPLAQKQDVFVSGQDQDKTKTNKKDLLLYAIGGIVFIAGAIFVIAKLRTPKGIPKSIGENTSQEINSGEKVITEVNGNNSQKFNDLKEKGEKLQAQLDQMELEANEKIDTVIKYLKPKNEKIAKESILVLTKHSEKLGISIDDYNSYLDFITPKNKDFAIKEGIPLMAENIELFNKVFDDKYHVPKLLHCLNAANKDVFKPFLESSAEIKTDSFRFFSLSLQSVNDKNKDLFLQIIDSPEKYNIKSFSDVYDYLKKNGAK